ncbi:MAG: type II CRISPR-associated endonuclease Cas1 [Firmicutes bacterium]|nr:type II CRISPR-associated endonuclease Cas1 [Bacillota bacterium]
MSWRIVVISSSAKLDYQMGYLVVRRDVTTKIHLSEISMLMIESTAVSLTASLLCELVKHKIKVIFCDEKRNPSSELQPYYGSHDTSIKVRKQMKWEDADRKTIWTEIVREKIEKQAEFLEELEKKEAAMLREYITQMEYGDATNREGHAAKVYFNALFGIGFSRSEDNPRNAALNYGYSIFLSAINREIAANGYITQIGLFHDNMFNPFNLASDLMEPWRVLIDRKVFRMRPEVFEHEQKMQVLDVLNDEVILGGKREVVNNALKIYCRSVFDAIEERDISLIRFYKNEL